MLPQAPTLWRGPGWALALLLASLSMLGPFSVDAYLPAFGDMAIQLQASPVQLQQTLSAYLTAFAVMNLFHGALSDSWGRRPVVLAAMGLYALASIGCALSASIGQLIACRALQGLCAGAGMVVSRAIIRDLFPPTESQKVMSLVTIFFGVAPAVAPLIGGLLAARLGWSSVFWMLALLGAVLLAVMARQLPESLDPSQRQSFHPWHLLAGYAGMLGSLRFLAWVAVSAVPFNGMFLYVLSSPVWLGEVLGLDPQHFFVFFVVNVGGVMAGAAASGRLAGRITLQRQIRWGFGIMAVATLANLLIHVRGVPPAALAMAPLTVYAFGWTLTAPGVTLLLLDLVPDRRGMASSVQSCLGSLANALVAGAVSPLVMHSARALALTSAAMLGAGLLVWLWVQPRMPSKG